MHDHPTEQELLTFVRHQVWSGFHTAAEVERTVEHELQQLPAGRVDADAVRRAVVEQVEAKRAAEAGWPQVTDCDRLDEAFRSLDRDGIAALHDASYTIADGLEDAVARMVERPDHYRGYCFYHRQDVERAIDGQPLYMSFGSSSGEEADSRDIAEAVLAQLSRAGLACEWQGTMNKRLELPRFAWQRRAPGG